MLEKLLITILIFSIAFTLFIFVVLLIYIFKYLKISPKIKSEQYTKLNKNAHKAHIVFLGDSLTEMYKVHDYFHNHYIYNRGISADTTDGVLKRLEGNVIVLEPKKIFVQIGTNDFQKRKSPNYILHNITKILKTLKEKLPESKLYCLSLYPVNYFAVLVSFLFTSPRKNKTIIYINNKLKDFCEQENITFIDVYPHLIDKKGRLKKEYTIEGLHINEEGYSAITKILMEYVNE